MRIGATTEHAPGQCPSCHRQLEASISVQGSDKPPAAGDVTVCFRCVTPLRIVSMDPMVLAVVSLDELPADVACDVAEAQSSLRRYWREQPR